ncbi:MAG: LLM class flavin-dependent oxidoreductase [Dehalococcoidia bacterium]
MKVGTPCAMDNVGEKPDHQIYWDHLRLADLAEPLGFDAIWTVEHHFTGYAQVPDPALLLTYLAGRTSRVYLGASVFVLPWHDPVRVAEQIAMLDVLSRGRIIVGFGRGAATVEYDGFGIPMEESRARFAEATQVVYKALTNDVFSHDGEFYKYPPISIRPRPISIPSGGCTPPPSARSRPDIMAKLGLGMLIIPGKDWPSAKADYDRYSGITIAAGHRRGRRSAW